MLWDLVIITAVVRIWSVNSVDSETEQQSEASSKLSKMLMGLHCQENFMLFILKGSLCLSLMFEGSLCCFYQTFISTYIEHIE